MSTLTKKQIAVQEKLEAIAHLKTLIKSGDTIYTVLRHVSNSGMSREITLLVAKNDQMINIDYWAAISMCDKIGIHEGIKISGCGMDMGFNIVYNLGRVLFPEEFKVEGRGRNGDMSGHDNDGGYALKQRWI